MGLRMENLKGLSEPVLIRGKYPWSGQVLKEEQGQIAEEESVSLSRPGLSL